MVDFTRRRLIAAAAAAGTLGAFAPRIAAADAAAFPGGCRLCGAASHRLRRIERGIRVGSPGQITIARSSGDAETDRFLGLALLRLATTFKVDPGFAFFDDGRSPNAFATDQTLLAEGQGTVMMGMHLFGEHMAGDQDAGMALIAICAHEFGHIHQMRNGYEPELARLDRSARPLELHADFLAGFYLGLRKNEHPDIDLQSAGRIFFGLGDTDFTSPQHHGTPEERIAAITAGYEFGRTGQNTIEGAAKAGGDLVKRMV